jgi:hypothetical protein
LAGSYLLSKSRFRDHEINEIYRILKDFQDDILKTWQKEQQKRGDR